MKLLNKKIVATALMAAFFVGVGAYFVWEQWTGPKKIDPNSVAGRTLTTNEILYQELLVVAPIAGELDESHPTNILWRERKDALFQAGYIEEKNIPFPKELSGKGVSWRFFTNFHARFRGVELSVHGLKRETPPIARVIARKTDLGPTGAIEQYIRNYDPEKQ